MHKGTIKSSLLLPFSFLSLLNVVPNGLASAFNWQYSWLGKTLAFLYWPALGAIVAQRKHWLSWGALVVCSHIWLLGLFIYWFRGRLTF